jgi:hypothetical protein
MKYDNDCLTMTRPPMAGAAGGELNAVASANKLGKLEAFDHEGPATHNAVNHG